MFYLYSASAQTQLCYPWFIYFKDQESKCDSNFDFNFWLDEFGFTTYDYVMSSSKRNIEVPVWSSLSYIYRCAMYIYTQKSVVVLTKIYNVASV